MSIPDPLLGAPAAPESATYRYRLTPRAKRKFQTPLDAAKLVDSSRPMERRPTTSASHLLWQRVGF